MLMAQYSVMLPYFVSLFMWRLYYICVCIYLNNENKYSHVVGSLLQLFIRHVCLCMHN